jgi:hypothetical protein
MIQPVGKDAGGWHRLRKAEPKARFQKREHHRHPRRQHQGIPCSMRIPFLQSPALLQKAASGKRPEISAFAGNHTAQAGQGKADTQAMLRNTAVWSDDSLVSQRLDSIPAQDTTGSSNEPDKQEKDNEVRTNQENLFL